MNKGPKTAENGDVRGRDNDGDGRKEPVFVKSYIKKDGTVVQGQYRALPKKTNKA